MINIANLEDENEIHSGSGQIEFLVFYDRVKSLVDFYNHTMRSYHEIILQKQLERRQMEENIDETLKSAIEEHDTYFTKEEAFIPIDDDRFGIETNYLEYQKMTLIIILFSEVEKLIDNLIELNQNPGNMKGISRKLRVLCSDQNLSLSDIDHIQNVFDELRITRNKLVHSYDYWDEEIIVGGNALNGLKQLDDTYLECLISRILDSIVKIDKSYSK